MREQLMVFGVASVLASVVAGPVAAQGNRIETGVDALVAYSRGPNSDHGFEVALPMGGVFSNAQPLGPIRIGLFVTDRISVEPSFSFNVMSDDDETLSRVGLAGHLLVHARADGSRPGLFFGIGGSMTSFSDEDASYSQFGASGLIGVRAPFSERLALRAAGGFARFFENEDFDARSTVYGTLGLSLFVF
jgi:hypothetical protein